MLKTLAFDPGIGVNGFRANHILVELDPGKNAAIALKGIEHEITDDQRADGRPHHKTSAPANFLNK